MISKWSVMGYTIAILAVVSPLAAQPDPSFMCIRRASALTNVPVSHISAQKRGGLGNGNDVIWWNAKLPNNQTVSGSCEVNPSTGRVVRLGTDQDSRGITSMYRMTTAEAERICEREARARFNPGDGLIVASVLPNTSTKSVFRVGWEYDSMSRKLRDGRCEIDSSTGHIRKFVASRGW